MKIQQFFWCVLAISCGTCITHAQGLPSQVPNIDVFGTAEIKVEPDIINWTVTVSIKGSDVSVVAEREDAIVGETLAEIKRCGVKFEDIQTAHVQLGEDWEYRSSSYVMEGYSAKTLITFRTSEIGLYRKIWLNLSKIVGVSITGTSWDSSRRIETQDRARESALKAAREKANAMARVMEVALFEPISIREIANESLNFYNNETSFTGVRGMPPGGVVDANSVAPGTIKIESRVEVEFRIGKQ